MERIPGMPPRPTTLGGDGIAIAADGATLSSSPLASRQLYAVEPEPLAQQVSEAEVAATMVHVGNKGSGSDGFESDAAGNVYPTIYRRWLSREGFITDLLMSLTPLATPLPDTGNLERDLEDISLRVGATLASPMMRQTLAIVAGASDERLRQATAAYWTTLLDHTSAVVRHAQERGQATRKIAAVDAIESLIGPIHFRVLVAHRPFTEAELRALAARTAHMLRPGAREVLSSPGAHS